MTSCKAVLTSSIHQWHTTAGTPMKIFTLMSHMQTDKQQEKRIRARTDGIENTRAGCSQLENGSINFFLHFIWINYPPLCDLSSQPLNPKIPSYAIAHSCANIPTTVTANKLTIQLFESGIMWLHGMWQYISVFCT